MILGIDPGSRTTGFGIVTYNQKQLCCVDFGTWSLTGEMPERLKQLYCQLKKLVAQHCFTGLALEQSFVHLNVASALKLGQVRGVVMAFSAEHQIPLHEYAARQVKQALVGTGAADKKQVQHMVSMLLNLNSHPPTDAADALGLAITHCHWRKDLSVNKVNTKRGANQRTKWAQYVRTPKR